MCPRSSCRRCRRHQKAVAGLAASVARAVVAAPSTDAVARAVRADRHVCRVRLAAAAAITFAASAIVLRPLSPPRLLRLR